MSRSKYNQEEDLKEIREGFEMFDVENKGQIDPLELKETMEEMNLKEKNPFIYDIISSFCSDKNIKSKGGLSSDDFISYLQNEMSDPKQKKGIKTIFNVFSDLDNKIPMTTFYQTAREVGDEEGGAEIRDLIEKSKTGGKEIDFNEFYDIMSMEAPDEKYKSKKEKENNVEYKNKKNSKYQENIKEEPKTEVVVEKTVIEKVNGEPIKESHYGFSKNYGNDKKDGDDKVEVKTTKYTYQSTSKQLDDENSEKAETTETKRYHRRFRSNQTNNVNNNNNNNASQNSGRRYRRKA